MAPVHRLAVELSGQGGSGGTAATNERLVMEKRSPTSQNYREAV